VPELPFIATPKSVAPQDQIALECCSGQPGGPVLVAVVEVGVPMFLKVALGTFDGGGVYSLSATVPSGLSGLAATCQAFGIASAGQVASSNRETITSNEGSSRAPTHGRLHAATVSPWRSIAQVWPTSTHSTSTLPSTRSPAVVGE
jgi:hypothetical protein